MISFRDVAGTGGPTAADGTAAVTGSGVIQARLPGHCALAARRSGTAPLHLRAGTWASRPRCEPRAAARAWPSSPPLLRSPGTGTPPACGSSGPHPCGCQSRRWRRLPGPPGAGQAQPGRTGVSAITFIGVPGRPERVDPGQRWSPYAAAPGQGPGKIPLPGAGCTANTAATCSAKHRSADGYSITGTATPPHRARDLGGAEAARRGARPARTAILTCCDRPERDHGPRRSRGGTGARASQHRAGITRRDHRMPGGIR
jgi:hypothetical protein